MAIQLTPEQERRIQAMVNAGAYPSAEEALNAALAAVETAATPGFEGTQEELETLLLDPTTAFRFRDAVKQSLDQLKPYPRIGSQFRGSIPGLRSWPVKGFEMTRI